MDAIRRILIVTALVPCLAAAAVVAPEHVHESEAAGHVSVVHRHLAAHQHHHADVDHAVDVSDLHHDEAELSDADGHVEWLDQVGVAEARHSFPQLFLVVSLTVDSSPQQIKHAVVTADIATLPHGPPRASLSLRAPPLASRLI
jgi:hypothetical protein